MNYPSIKAYFSNTSLIVFDLDDTLYKEVDYLKSAYLEIAKNLDEEHHLNLYDTMFNMWCEGLDVFEYLLSEYPKSNFSKNELLSMYRNHIPKIFPSPSVKPFIEKLNHSDISMSVITDGRSKTQRNKLRALNLLSYFEKNNIVISEEIGSEKPSLENYVSLMDSSVFSTFCYIGDNYKKDFITPKNLGWLTIGLVDDGRNIHKRPSNLSDEFLPHIEIENFKELDKLVFE